MSTDLYGVRILEIAPHERRVRMRVFVVYETRADAFDYTPLPVDRSFFVRALAEAPPWKYEFGHAPIDAAIPEGLRYNEDFINSDSWRYVERVEQLATRNDPLPDPPDEGITRFHYERRGCWADEHRLPQADYDVWVTDPAYLEHLVLGMSFGAAAYPSGADALTAAEAPALPDFAREWSLLPFGKRGVTRSIAVSHDGRYLAALSSSGRVVAYETTGWTEVLRTTDACSAYELGFLPGHPALLIAHRLRYEGAVAFDLARRGAQLKKIPWKVPRERYQVPQFVADRTGGLRALAGARLQITDATGHLVRELGTRESAYSVALSADGAVVAAGTREGGAAFLEVWRVSDGARLAELKLPREARSVALSPDGRFVTFANQYDTQEVFRVSDGELVRMGKSHRGSFFPMAIEWSGDGRFVAVRMEPWTREGPCGILIAPVGTRDPLERGPVAQPVSREPSKIQPALLRTVTREAPDAAEWAEILGAHREFLESGGAAGSFEVVEVAGLATAVYSGAGAARGRMASLRMRHVHGVMLVGAELAYADLTAVVAPGVDASRADLAGATLTDGDFVGARFAGARLCGADFSRSDLRGADFDRCDLRGACFTGARIGGVVLRDAKLDGIAGFGAEPSEPAPRAPFFA